MQETDALLNHLAINTVVTYLCRQHQRDPLAAIAKLITTVAAYRSEKYIDDRDLYQAAVCFSDLNTKERHAVTEQYFAYLKKAQAQGKPDEHHCSTPGIE